MYAGILLNDFVFVSLILHTLVPGYFAEIIVPRVEGGTVPGTGLFILAAILIMFEVCEKTILDGF